jgi:hypothetical protein
MHLWSVVDDDDNYGHDDYEVYNNGHYDDYNGHDDDE